MPPAKPLRQPSSMTKKTRKRDNTWGNKKSHKFNSIVAKKHVLHKPSYIKRGCQPMTKYFTFGSHLGIWNLPFLESGSNIRYASLKKVHTSRGLV